jgi:hypothetical protein
MIRFPNRGRGTPVAPTIYPLWRSSMAQWEWKELSGTSITLAAPTIPPTGSRRTKVDAWNGLAVVGTRIIWAGVGGHADYAGNEITAIELGVDSPGAPVILKQPTPAAYYIIDADYYAVEPDGKQRPTSDHTYYNQHPDLVRNKVFRLGVGSAWGGGNWTTNNVDAADLNTNDWDHANTWPDPTQSTPRACAQCRDAVTGNVYVTGISNLLRWNRVDATWTVLAAWPSGANGTATYYRASLVDTLRNRVVFLGNAFAASGVILIYDIAGGTWSQPSLTGSYATLVTSQVGATAHYDSASDQYLYKSVTGSQVVAINPSTFATSLLSTTGPAVPNALNGNFGRFQHMPDLGGYCYYPDGPENCWFLASV